VHSNICVIPRSCEIEKTVSAKIVERVIDETVTIDQETGEVIDNLNMSEGVGSFAEVMGQCPKCSGNGVVDVIRRVCDVLDSPKLEMLKDYFELYEEEGRLVVWAGFQASVDRIIELARKLGWVVLKIDGRGTVAIPPTESVHDLLCAMDASDPRRKELMVKHPKLCTVGNSIAGGISLTLTASNTAIYYSNSHDGGARRQSEARIHRAGMDSNRGCKIIDFQCLEIDKLVLNSLNNKRKLESITLGEIADAMKG
jgi:hypothetical protein